MSKPFFCVALLCLILVSALGWAQNGQEKNQPAPPLPAVSCMLSAVTQPWQVGHPAIVSIELKNEAGTPLDLSVVPYISLRSKSGRAYTSPVDIVQNHALETTRETLAGGTGVNIKAIPMHLHLDNEGLLTFKVDANKTKWDSEFSAKWPSLPLSKVALPGAYQLTLKLWVGDTTACNATRLKFGFSAARIRNKTAEWHICRSPSSSSNSPFT